ncbi:MAG: orotidine-5'-phosphate decarboxylase, partial [Verrucomicrobia bacterium]|nr:orotidine-5'-phosphate decarboxylase [Verrucomicrobiota bacterium]
DKDVFLDLKFHDIPNTVAHAVAAATRLDIQMLTVHTSGGHTMLEAAVTASKEEAAALGITPPLVLGVTILTSLGSDDMQKIGMDANVSRQVHRLSRLAADSGIHGLVCSPLEVAKLRQEMPEYFTLVTPGIRRSEDTRSDQKRTLSAPDAIEAGADRLVIGRPICAAPDPRKAAEEILRSITA